MKYTWMAFMARDVTSLGANVHKILVGFGPIYLMTF